MKIDFKNEMKFFYNALMYYSSFFGSFLFVIAALIFLFVIDQNNFATKFGIGICISLFFEYLIKFLYKRKRPDFKTDKEKALFERFQEVSSFPSGHSATISLFATLTYLVYKSINLTLFFGILAVLVGLSRLHLKRHYLTDVIAGYVLGISVAILIS